MEGHGSRRHGRALGVGAALACTAALWLPATAGAAVIPVTEAADDLLSAPDDGDCALREAVEAANRNTAVDQCVAGEAEPASDTVLLADGATYTLTGTPGDDDNLSGDLDVNTVADSGLLTIQGGSGGGSTIDVGGIDRALDVTGASSLDSLTITNGDVPTVGGGIRNGGGTLRVSRSRIAGNVGVLGGGIANQSGGTVILNTSVVSGNHARTTQVEPVAGGGIMNEGTATIDGSVVSSNDAQGMGGLPVAGGGIANLQDGSLTITDSTISDNAMSGGDQFGGGVNHEGGASSLSIRNSTISGNLAPGIGGDGGGLNSFGGEVGLNHVTFAGNHADDRGDALNSFGGTPLALRASVIDNGVAACQGDIGSGGYNVDAAASCASAANPTDVQNAVTGLDLHLANNGGPTAGPPGAGEVPKTHALVGTSPAVDRVPTSQCFAMGTTPLTADQRGVARPSGTGCDSGAYEVFPPVAQTSQPPTSSPVSSPQQQQQQVKRKKCKRKKRTSKKRRCKRRR